MNGEPEPAVDAEPPTEGLAAAGISGLVEDVRRLAGEARDFAQAELDYQKARARFAVGAATKIALFGLVSLIVAVFALGAVVLGLLLGLATLVGPWWATLIVAGGLTLVALVFGLAARSRYSRALGLIAPPESADG